MNPPRLLLQRKQRKLGDSNPRYSYPYGSLANYWFQPLTQTSLCVSLSTGALFLYCECKGNKKNHCCKIFPTFFIHCADFYPPFPAYTSDTPSYNPLIRLSIACNRRKHADKPTDGRHAPYPPGSGQDGTTRSRNSQSPYLNTHKYVLHEMP